MINDWSMFTTILNIVADEGNVDSVISFLAHTGTSPGVMEKLKPALQEVRERFPDRVFMLCARLPREMADEFFEIGFLTYEDPTRAIAAVAALSRLAQGFAKPRGGCGQDSRPRGHCPQGRSTRRMRSGCSAKLVFRSRRSASRGHATRRSQRPKRLASRSC